MLTLLFNEEEQKPRSAFAGLLALLLETPRVGAVVTSVQAAQQDYANADVRNPQPVVGGDSWNRWFWRPRAATIHVIEVSVASVQAPQESHGQADMIDVELEMVLAILIAAA